MSSFCQRQLTSIQSEMFEGIYELYICNNASVDSSNLNLFANIDVYIIFLIQPFDPMAHLSYFFCRRSERQDEQDRDAVDQDEDERKEVQDHRQVVQIRT